MRERERERERGGGARYLLPVLMTTSGHPQGPASLVRHRSTVITVRGSRTSNGKMTSITSGVRAVCASR